MSIGALAIGLAVLLSAGFVYERISRRKDAKKAPTGKMIDVGGYRLHITESGQGGPTVVLVHGAGDCSYSWMHICKEVSQFTRVITYDRPGMGSSDPGPAPSPEHTVKELNTLLRKAGVPGPYIFAGHSLGGLITRLYTYEYPDQVAGIVLLDSTHEFLQADAKFKQGFAFLGIALKIFRLLSHFGILRFSGNILNTIPMFGHERKYYKQQLSDEEYNLWKGHVYGIFAEKSAEAEFKGTWAILDAASNRLNHCKERPQFGDLPIAVVNNPGFGQNWTEMQRELASRSTNHFFKTSDRKGHSLQMPRPEYVIQAIHHIVNQARERNGRTLAEQNQSPAAAKTV